MAEARALYEAKVASAIQEIEDGLSRYRASLTRLAGAETTARQQRTYLLTVEARHKEGASNLLELEEGRRTWLASRQVLLAAQQEHLQVWTYLNRVTAAGAGHSLNESKQ